MTKKTSAFALFLGSIAALAPLSLRAELPQNYSSLTGDAKRAALWREITETEYNPESYPSTTPGIAGLLGLLSPSYLAVTFNHQEDVLPRGRTKAIHAFGNAVLVRWNPTQTNPQWTGVFKDGGVGILRLSLAAPGGSFTPGAAIKILANGATPSANIMVMPSLEGQGNDRNPFTNNYRSDIDPPRSAVLRLLAGAFEKALTLVKGRPESALHLPLDELAATNFATGEKISNWSAPYEIQLVPTPRLKSLYDEQPRYAEMRFNLRGLPRLFTYPLFKVVARARPGDAFVEVGELMQESAWIASKFGDQNLFFQHPRHVQR